MLNEIYYHRLINKYSLSRDYNKSISLTKSIICENYNSKDIYFNFPKHYDLSDIINLLYIHFSKKVFMRYADLTDYSVGDKLKRKEEKGKNVYIIKEIKGLEFSLVKEKDKNNTKIPIITFDKLKRNFIQVKQSTRNSTLSKFNDFFEKVNDYGFLPTHFSKKIVLIAGQTIWNNLKKKDCIPSIYLPNTRENEQTTKKSIEALDDCIAYVTPKYYVCYEEILRKNIAVDTIIVCNTDLALVSQIIQDQSKYHFKLIILSNESEILKNNNFTLWNWHKEEIDLLDEYILYNTVNISRIQNRELNTSIQHFEHCMRYVSNLEIPIKLNSYGYFFRLALNAIQEKQFDYLLLRLKSNKELERNEGGYEDFTDKNPKEALTNIILYLRKHNPKQNRLKQIIDNAKKDFVIVADREDADFLKTIKSRRCEIVTNTELKKLLKNDKIDNRTIVFYSFNGSKDFHYIYNLPNDIQLVLYKQEEELYLNQLHAYKKALETELTSRDRYDLCGIEYKPINEPEIKVSPTLQQIIERLEQRSNTAYDGYKEESDCLLDDLEEKITYRITFNDGSIVEMESNETVFNEKGALIKSCQLKISNKIRIYPKEQLAENLFQIAIEVEPDKFGQIDKYSALWQGILRKMLDDKNIFPDKEVLYSKLKQHGLRVLPVTIENYLSGKSKFPMYNSDLKAICTLADEIVPENTTSETILSEIKKHKRLYNSTMIALGRGVKQELQQFLKDKTIGEILQKKNFSIEALQRFINEYMPLLTTTRIEEISDEQ